MTPGLERLLATIEAVEDPAWCEGSATSDGLGFTVGRDDCAAIDAQLVDWLTKRCEPAPFGHGTKTKVDKKVRSTLRVKARGDTKVRGFDLGAIVETVEEEFATNHRLEAALLDVLVYPTGGKFLRHKDTPRAPRQLGTLIVEVPVEHKGGKLTFDDGSDKHEVDWSGKPKDRAKLRWVALFGDVDHTISEVKSGTRVTLVYTLALTDTPRTDANVAAHLDAIADAIITLDHTGVPDVLYIPCTRMIVAPDSPDAALDLDVLRGGDRHIADTFARCGAKVSVCEMLVPAEEDRPATGLPQAFDFSIKLAKRIPDAMFAGSALSFSDDIVDEYAEEEPTDIPSLEPYLDQTWVQSESWLMRKRAHAKHVYEGLYSETGYFGNEYSAGHIYRLAALEVKLPGGAKPPKKLKAAKPKPKAKPAKPKPKAKAKPKKKR